MKPKHRRLALVLSGLAMAGMGALLLLNTLEDSVTYFYSPSDIASAPPAQDTYMRVGGLVEAGSLESLSPRGVRFRITDNAHSLSITYLGILPGLFRENQGIIAEGTYRGGEFTADRILAKHDEYYMPPEVAKSLKKAGYWRPADKEPDADSGNTQRTNPAASESSETTPQGSK